MTVTLLPHEAAEIDAFTWDVTPRASMARVRPFIFSVLLWCAAVRPEELLASMAPLAHPDDLRIWDEYDGFEGEVVPKEMTGLEICIASTLQGLVDAEILRKRDDGLFVLTSNRAALARIVSIVAATDGQLPDHLLSDLNEQRRLLHFSTL